jgi:hypothetical protein
VEGDPINYFDPKGLFAEEPGPQDPNPFPGGGTPHPVPIATHDPVPPPRGTLLRLLSTARESATKDLDKADCR